MLRCRGDSEGGKRGKRRGGEGEAAEEGGDLTGEGRSNLYWDPLLLPILSLWLSSYHWALQHQQIESKHLQSSHWSDLWRNLLSLVEREAAGEDKCFDAFVKSATTLLPSHTTGAKEEASWIISFLFYITFCYKYPVGMLSTTEVSIRLVFQENFCKPANPQIPGAAVVGFV